MDDTQMPRQSSLLVNSTVHKKGQGKMIPAGDRLDLRFCAGWPDAAVSLWLYRKLRFLSSPSQLPLPMLPPWSLLTGSLPTKIIFPCVLAPLMRKGSSQLTNTPNSLLKSNVDASKKHGNGQTFQPPCVCLICRNLTWKNSTDIALDGRPRTGQQKHSARHSKLCQPKTPTS